MFRIRIMVKKTLFSDASATGEILAKFFFDSGYQVDQTTAEALYLGICTDTGQFCYSATNASVLKYAGFFAKREPVLPELHTNFMKKKNPVVSSSCSFLASFKMEYDDRVCIGSILGKYYTETGTKPEDAENFVDYARSLDGVEIGVLLEERDGKIKGSFRAKDESFRVDLWPRSLTAAAMLVRPVSMWKTRLMPFIHLWWMRLENTSSWQLRDS